MWKGGSTRREITERENNMSHEVALNFIFVANIEKLKL